MDIIISRYNEDLKWTTNDIFNNYKYTVYNKGLNEDFEKTNIKQIINIKNEGRCDHTYLFHIVSNYNNLSDITVFLPGSLDMEYKKNKAIDMLTRIKNNDNKKAVFIGEYNKNIKNSFYNFKLDEWKSSNPQNFTINDESLLKLSKIRPFGKWYQYYFNNLLINYFSYWGIFSIDKRDIIQHPVQKYVIFLKQLESSSNPEVGHYIERSWGAIFHPIRFTKIYLKPH